MRRRNFFAVLFAPLLARFAPKPTSIYQLDGFDQAVINFIQYEQQVGVTYYPILSIVRGSATFEGGTYIEEPIIYGEPK